MKAGDWILDAVLVEEDDQHCLILEIHEADTNQISYTRIHANETLLDLNIEALKSSKIVAMCLHQETGNALFAFQTDIGLITWTCENPGGELWIID